MMFVSGCIEAIEPEFDFQDGLIIIDAFALSEEGLSQVSIKKSVELSGFGSFVNVGDAQVSFVNSDNGIIEDLTETSEGFYVTSPTFVVKEGEIWKLNVVLADGRKYESSNQKISRGVLLEDLQATYMDEVTFDVGFNDFVPGHKLTATFTDPAGEENFYIWRMRSFEPLNTCLTCFDGIYRNGDCLVQDIPRFLPQYHDYLCLTDCWLIRYGSTLPILNDQFTDGVKIENQEVGNVIFYRKQNILVEIQQLSVNKSTFKYYETISDLVEESGGLNAPTPAALLGNIISTSNSEDYVIGNFTAAMVSTQRVFLKRQLINNPVDPDRFIHLESCIGCPTAYPCEEGENRTGIKPIGWPE
jgi:hypothetical protein